MSVICNALARFRRASDNVDLHFVADQRIATCVRPIIEKLIADSEDGETYRTAFISWCQPERPPLAVYQGSVSSCRIDGPLQLAVDHAFPLGGLILSPGVTVHLDPFEASNLRDHMRAAIERAILAWLADNGQRDASPVSIEFDRSIADRQAKGMIADWVARKEAKHAVAEPVAEGPDHV